MAALPHKGEGYAGRTKDIHREPRATVATTRQRQKQHGRNSKADRLKRKPVATKIKNKNRAIQKLNAAGFPSRRFAFYTLPYVELRV